MDNASWYYFYADDDPQAEFTPLGWARETQSIIPLSSLESMGFTDKIFVKVTAGAGPFPSFDESLWASPAKKE